MKKRPLTLASEGASSETRAMMPEESSLIMTETNVDVQIFDNAEFGNVRTIEEDGQVLFCGNDIAKALGYAKPRNAMKAHCHGALKQGPILDNLGRTQKARFITEPDVYRLISHSKLPNAQRFEQWIFEEVLPSIRRTGGYVAAKPDESPEEIMARAVLVAQETIERQKKQLDEMKPKAVFADAVATSKTSILIGDLAKILKQNGVEMGQRRLFEWMRQRGYLMKANGSSHNMPTQRSMERGWFEIKETSITHSDGHITVQRTPKVTGKGQQYFINLFLNGAA